jgi:hypothetical protein
MNEERKLLLKEVWFNHEFKKNEDYYKSKGCPTFLFKNNYLRYRHWLDFDDVMNDLMGEYYRKLILNIAEL